MNQVGPEALYLPGWPHHEESNSGDWGFWEGLLPPVPVARSNQGSVQGTTSATSSSTQQQQYYVPSPQPFVNPPSASAFISGLGDDALNISGFDFSAQTPQITVQTQPQQVTLQAQPSTLQQPQFTLVQQPQALQPQQQQYTVIQPQQSTPQSQSSSSSTTPTTPQHPGPPP